MRRRFYQVLAMTLIAIGATGCASSPPRDTGQTGTWEKLAHLLVNPVGFWKQDSEVCRGAQGLYRVTDLVTKSAHLTGLAGSTTLVTEIIGVEIEVAKPGECGCADRTTTPKCTPGTRTRLRATPEKPKLMADAQAASIGQFCRWNGTSTDLYIHLTKLNCDKVR